MGLALTNDGSAQYVTGIDASTSAGLRAAIQSALTAAGWTAEAAADGMLYTATSPQGLQMELYVYDDGSYDAGAAVTGDYIKLLARGAGGSPAGREHRLKFGTDLAGSPAAPEARTYWLFCDSCQLFIATTGHYLQVADGAQPRYYHAFGCGVPYISDPPEGSRCAEMLEGDSITEAWWSFGTGRYSLGEAASWRNGAVTWTQSALPDFAVCVNGSAWDSAEYSPYPAEAISYADRSALRLIPMTFGTDFHGLFANDRPPIRKYPGGADDWIATDPLVAWGSAYKQQPRIIGQLWNAFLISDWRPLDEELSLLDGQILAVVYGHGVPREEAEGSLTGSSTNRSWGGILALVYSADGGLFNYAY